VQVVVARLDAAGLVHAQLVGTASAGRRDEANLLATLGSNAGGSGIQRIARAPKAEPRRERLVDGVT
jgi:hypothetical protein